MQYQIIPRSAVIVRNEVVADAAVGECDFLPLREVTKSPLDERQSGVVDHGQIRPDLRREIESEVHRVARGRVGGGGDRHGGG